MIKLEYLRHFLAVAEHDTLNQAARAIHRTPSALSMTLKNLEQTLGGPLFEGERKQHLSPLGEFVYSQAQQVINTHERAVTDIMAYARGETGVLRVAAVPSVATRLLSTTLSTLLETHPKLRIELRDIDSAAVVAAVLNGEVDIGIASVAEDLPQLHRQLYLQDTFVCVCADGHPLAQHQGAIDGETLAKHRFIANGLSTQISDASIQALSRSASLKVLNVSSLLAYIKAGAGVTVLPKTAVENAPGLCQLPLREPQALRELYLLHLRERSLSPAAKLLLNQLEFA